MAVSQDKKLQVLLMREELTDLIEKYPQSIAMATLSATYFTLVYEIMEDVQDAKKEVLKQLEIAMKHLERINHG